MKLIKIAQDHYVIVDDSEIQEGDMIYLLYGNTPSTKQGGIARCEFPDANNLGVLWKKITHSTQPLKYSSKIGKYWGRVQPIELSEVKELIGEVDMEKKSYDILKGFVITKDERRYFELGYTKALEDNKEKKYTEEDMRKAMSLARKGAYDMTFDSFDNIIKSLQPKTEWEVEFVDGKLTLKK